MGEVVQARIAKGIAVGRMMQRAFPPPRSTRSDKGRKRGPLSQEHRAKISAGLRGTMNSAMWGKARKVGELEHEPLLRQLGDNLRDARKERDIPVSELAAASGIEAATISRIENAQTRKARNLGPTMWSIFRLALAMGMRPYELIP